MRKRSQNTREEKQGERRGREGIKKNLEEQKKDRRCSMFLVKDSNSPAGPGGTATAYVAHSPPGACRQEFNAGSNV